jgi:plastocyanin
MKPRSSLALALVLAPLCASAAEHLVQARPDLSFAPADLVIAVGDAVRFENSGGFHNVREVDSELSTTPVANGFCAPQPGCAPSGAAWSSVVAFPNAGVFHYLCEVHGSAMRGKITVTADAPPAGISKSVAVLEDHEVAVTLEGSDPDGTPVFISLDPALEPEHGQLSNFDGVSVTYQPAQDYVGTDSFGFQVASGGVSVSAVISLDVLPDPAVNDTPAVSAYRMLTTPSGIAVVVTLDGTDPDGDPLTFEVVGEPPRHGRLLGAPPNLSYQPDTGFFGYDRFSYRAHDQAAFSPAGQITVRVPRPSDPHPGRLFAVPEAEPQTIVELVDGAEVRRFAAPCVLPSQPGQDGLAFDGTYLWALCNANTQVLRLDPDNGETIAALPIEGGPFDGIALASRLLLNRSADHVLQLRSADSGALEYEVDYGAALGATGALAGFPGGGSVLMAAGTRVVIYDPASNAVVASLDGLDGGSGVAALPDVITAPAGSSNGVRTMLGGGPSPSSPFALPYAVRSLAGDQGLTSEPPERYRRIFAAPRDSDTQIAELDPASGAEIHRFEAPVATFAQSWGETGLAFDGESLWFISRAPLDGAKPLFRLDPNTGAVRQAIDLAADTTFDGLAVQEKTQVLLFDHIADAVLAVDVESGAKTSQALPILGDWIGGLGMLAGFNELLASLSDGTIARLSPPNFSLQGSFSAYDGRVMGVGALNGEILAAGPFDVGEPPSLRFFNPDGALLREVPLPYRVASLGADDVNADYPLIATVQRWGGDDQAAQAGTDFAQALRVRVLDAYGHPVPRVPVSFRAAPGSGIAFGASPGTTVLTDLRGVAASPLPTAGPALGMSEAQAWIAASHIATHFALTVTAEPPIAIFSNGFESPGAAVPKRQPPSVPRIDAGADGSYP